jgi:hypothetical protein
MTLKVLKVLEIEAFFHRKGGPIGELKGCQMSVYLSTAAVG